MMPARKSRTTRLKKQQADFRRHWFAVFRSVAARADGSITPGELRLAMRLMAASLFKSRLKLRIDNSQLEKASKQTRSGLYAARSALVGLHMIAATKDGEDHWVYEFMNPATGKTFPGDTGSIDSFTFEDDNWGKMASDIT